MGRFEDEAIRFLFNLQVNTTESDSMTTNERQSSELPRVDTNSEELTPASDESLDDVTRDMLRKKEREMQQVQMAGAGTAQQSIKQVFRGQKVGRNQPCPCGSGKKYKKCCGRAA